MNNVLAALITALAGLWCFATCWLVWQEDKGRRHDTNDTTDLGDV